MAIITLKEPAASLYRAWLDYLGRPDTPQTRTEAFFNAINLRPVPLH